MHDNFVGHKGHVCWPIWSRFLPLNTQRSSPTLNSLGKLANERVNFELPRSALVFTSFRNLSLLSNPQPFVCQILLSNLVMCASSPQNWLSPTLLCRIFSYSTTYRTSKLYSLHTPLNLPSQAIYLEDVPSLTPNQFNA